MQTKLTNILQTQFNGFTVHSKLYDIDVLGYQKGLNKLHLFDIDTIDETIVNDGISFDQKDIRKNLTLFLYPDDSTKEGQMLRIYQQYFKVMIYMNFINTYVYKSMILIHLW